MRGGGKIDGNAGRRKREVLEMLPVYGTVEGGGRGVGGDGSVWICGRGTRNVENVDLWEDYVSEEKIHRNSYLLRRVERWLVWLD